MISNVSIHILTLVSFLTWLVFVLTAIKIYKFFTEFEKFKSKNDIELNSVVWTIKKIEKELPVIIDEIRRTNSLLYDIYKGKNDTSAKKIDIEYLAEDIIRHEHPKGEDLSDNTTLP